jgi:hypothetical protein
VAFCAVQPTKLTFALVALGQLCSVSSSMLEPRTSRTRVRCATLPHTCQVRYPPAHVSGALPSRTRVRCATLPHTCQVRYPPAHLSGALPSRLPVRPTLHTIQAQGAP